MRNVKNSKTKVVEMLHDCNISDFSGPAPSKYYGGQNYQQNKYAITVDWFEITCKGYPTGYPMPGREPDDEITADDGNITLKRISAGGTHYRHKYLVFVGDEETPFAHILCLPRPGSVLSENFNQLKIDNAQLYVTGWTGKLRYVLSALGLELNNITRLDVALDGGCWFDVYRDFQSRRLIKVGRATITEHAEIEEKQTGEAEYRGKFKTVTHYSGSAEITGYDWGKRKSDKWVSCYNKSRELEKTKKTYIRDWWERNGLSDEAAPIERLELKLRSEAIKKTVDPETGAMGIDIPSLERGGYLAAVMRVHLHNFYDFVIPGPDGNVSRCDRVPLVNWDAIGAEQLERVTGTPPPNQVWRAKRATTKLVHDAVRGDYLDEATADAVSDDLEVDVTEELVEAIIVEVKAHLKRTWIFPIPKEAWRGIEQSVRQVLGQKIKAGVSRETLKRLPVALARSMARQHGFTEWFEKKAAEYEYTSCLMPGAYLKSVAVRPTSLPSTSRV